MKKKIKTEITMETEFIDNGTLPCDILDKLELIKKSAYLMSRLDKIISDVLDECEKEIKESRSRKPKIETTDDLMELINPHLSRDQSSYWKHFYWDGDDYRKQMIVDIILTTLVSVEAITSDKADELFSIIFPKTEDDDN